VSDLWLWLYRRVVGAMMDDELRKALAECDRLRAQLARVDAFRIRLLKDARQARLLRSMSATWEGKAYQDAADRLFVVLSDAKPEEPTDA
jgi:hypothetical protein